MASSISVFEKLFEKVIQIRVQTKVTKNILCHVVTTQERLVLKKYYFDPYFCGYYTREVNKQERLMMARVR